MPDRYGTSLLPTQLRQRRLHRYDRFRGSIARLLCSLFTLHAAITDDYAKLVSDWWSTFAGWDFKPYPQGFIEEFLLLNIYSPIIYIYASVSPLPGLILAQLTLLTSFFTIVGLFLF